MRDLTGEVFGRLTVVEYAGRRGHESYWDCRCECGNLTNVAHGNLIHGHTNSCGCLQRERTRERSVTHGHSTNRQQTPTYKSWYGAISRCEKESNGKYQNYGGRGIRVCERWHDFANFLKDMGERPEGDYSLGRIDNDGDYCLENCRWETQSQQQRNRRDNVIVEFGGRAQCVAAWAGEIGMRPGTLSYRLNSGWSIEQALTAPIRDWESEDDESC